MDQAESLRELMKKQSQNSLARVITVTSGKGGVGKSSISVNLALQLAKLGKRVIILDADFGLANIEVMLGIRPKYNLADLMFKGMKLKDIITEGPMGIGFISGGTGIQELNNLKADQIELMTSQLYELDELADIVIIDTGAGISSVVLQFVILSSEVLLVATPEPTSLTDAYALLKTLNSFGDIIKDKTISLIANRVPSDREGHQLYNNFNVVVEKFLDIKLEYMGAVLQDSNLMKAVLQQEPLSVMYPASPATKSVQAIAEKIYSGDSEQIVSKGGITRIFTGIIRASLLKRGEVKNGV
ncbi:MAG: MinD/ParA family protein [Lachnospiraceae bacterium]|nr:MinD/ParA family protein [Lachnospiraceae bacterium]